MKIFFLIFFHPYFNRNYFNIIIHAHVTVNILVKKKKRTERKKETETENVELIKTNNR